jgi:hypothetical protein
MLAAKLQLLKQVFERAIVTAQLATGIQNKEREWAVIEDCQRLAC